MNNLWTTRIYNNTSDKIENVEIIFKYWNKEKILEIDEITPNSYVKIINSNFIFWEWIAKIRFFKDNKKYEKTIIEYYVSLDYIKTFIDEKDGEIKIYSESFWK